MGNGNRPTPEFRREAVRLALTRGHTRREIAEGLGIGLSTLQADDGQRTCLACRPQSGGAGLHGGGPGQEIGRRHLLISGRQKAGSTSPSSWTSSLGPRHGPRTSGGTMARRRLGHE